MKIDINYIDSLNGVEFEEYLFNLFNSKGYICEFTPLSNDYGADLILKNDNKIIIIQAKCYSNNVGLSAVQEIVAAQKYYNANDCMVITNSYFTKNAKELAKCNSVYLVDRDDLINSNFAILNFVCKSNIPNNFKTEIEVDINLKEPLLIKAVELLTDLSYVTIGFFQRKLYIGYNRANRLVNTLEHLNILKKDHTSFLINQEAVINFLHSNKKTNILKKMICKIFK